MTTFDPHTSIDPSRIDKSSGISGSPLSMSPDSPSSYSITEEIPTPQLYGDQTVEPLDLSMFDPSLFPDVYADHYFPTDPLFLDGPDASEQPTSIGPPSSELAAPKPCSTFSPSIDDQSALSPTSSVSEASSTAPPLEVTTEEVLTTTTLTKRPRGDQRDDIGACWTSPLCPNNTRQDGTPPDPATCGGGCAPFLFADAQFPETSLDTTLINLDLTNTKYSPPAEEVRSSSKRSETQASNHSPSQTGRRQNSKSVTGRRNAQKTATLTPKREEPVTESITDDDNNNNNNNNSSSNKDTRGKKRVPHNEVERKYRDSVNHQMDCLRRVVPSLRTNARLSDGADIEDLPTPSKPSKAVILGSATAYIKKMEREKKQMAEEMEKLQHKVRTLQALVKCDDCSLVAYVRNVNLRQMAKP